MQSEQNQLSSGAVIATSPTLTPKVVRYVEVNFIGGKKFVTLNRHRFAWDHFFEVNTIINDTAIQSK